jgi:CheY-like chemotaxis protein
MRAALPAKRNIALELGGPAEHVAEADAAQVQQVIMNLLVNASEAIQGDSGTITVRTDVAEHRPAQFSLYMQSVVPSGTYVMLEIRDNGIGMGGDTLKKIFDPFFTTKFTGRGLGLSAVLGIVKAHHGDIEVVSAPGIGSAFRIFLPGSRPAIQRSIDPPRVPAAEERDHTILVVDDEELIRKLAISALKLRHLNVLVAKNGMEALELLDAEPAISVVILDLTMPVMGGEETLPRIRSMRPNLPVIISSGFNEVEVLRRFESSGIIGVLPKPYTVAKIISKVMDALQAQE